MIFYGGAPDGARNAYLNGEYVSRHVDYVEEERAARHIAAQRAGWLRRFCRPGELLELGSGRGFFLDQAARQGFSAIGVEPSPELVERARAELGVEVEQGFLDEVDLGERRFDMVCMFHVFEHVEDPVDLLEQVSERLNPGGRVVLEVPNLASAMARRRAEDWNAVHPSNLHISQFTPSSLRRVISRADFEIVAVDTIAPWSYVPYGDRWRLRPLLGYSYRAAALRTLKSTHPSGFDHLRLVARSLA